LENRIKEPREQAANARLLAVYGMREFAMVGGLMSYGASFADIYRRLAGFADQIIKGTGPANLPIQRPTKFELVINLKTPKALGLTISEFAERSDSFPLHRGRRPYMALSGRTVFAEVKPIRRKLAATLPDECAARVTG
jgi:ABC transporter substrate binding protein